jgi:NTE family protein
MNTRFLIPLFLITLLPFFSSAQNTKDNNERPKVGLVLSGGGAKGFAYIGLLRAVQEAELQVDYVGGTSIGSIMSGLYALGYSPDAIEEMIRSQDWEALLEDDIDRKYISFEEKEFTEKSVVTVPFKSRKITLGPSLRKGQEIDLLLNRYFSPAYNIDDFNELHTPFLCMATDLITGEPIIIRRGSLARAIRASMSIPGFFPPVEYEGKLLVDGGVVNNFPVKNVMDMGAEYIIGGDVQPGLKDDPKELNSITTILEQMITFGREEANKEAYKLTDLYIPLDNPYSILAFEEYDALITFGDSVADIYRDRIKKLADSLNSIEYKPLKPYDAQPLDSVDIRDIYFQGFKKLPLAYFINNWKEFSGRRVAISDIEDKIRLMYGTRFFQHVYYEFEQEGDHVNMTVNVVEADPGEVSAAIHYDNNYLGSILVNASLRNVLGKRSKLFADLVLGPNPRLRTLYMIDNGKRFGLGAMLDFYSFTFDIYNRHIKQEKWDYTNFKASLFAQNVVNNVFRFRIGADYEYFRFRQDVLTDTLSELLKDFTSYGTLFLSLNADTRDHHHFPSRGFRSELRVEYVIPMGNNLVSTLFDNSLVARFQYEQNIGIGKRWVFRPGVFAGGTIPSNALVPVHHWFAFGGLNPTNYVSSYVSFTGVRFFQQMGQYALMGKAHLQFNFAKKLYATVLLDVGNCTLEFDDLFDFDQWVAGYGISIGYDSFIGPVELTLMGSNYTNTPLLFLNLGYWF